jgi:hypothetical protein
MNGIKPWAISPDSHCLQMKTVAITEVPHASPRGRVGFIESSPFWTELKARLTAGLSPMEAVEIELNPIAKPEGGIISSDQELAALRHEFQKSGLSKQFSLIVRGESCHRLFVVSHESAVALTNNNHTTSAATAE